MNINQKGLGLIETMLTFLIIAGSVLALIKFQSTLTYNNSVSQQQNTALILATNQIETLRDFVVLSGTNSYQNIASGSSSYNDVNATYAIVWTITTNTNPNYKTIDVTVTWTDRYNVAHSVRLTSRVAGIDPQYSATIM